jgi:Zn finger protein HypA/HybF involved in hydrogenase expression
MTDRNMPYVEPGRTPMDEPEAADPTIDLMLDGNAAAGTLAALFGVDVTVVPGKCDHCGHIHALAELDAWTRAPGSVLRCPDCHGVVLRIVETADATYLDARGAAYLRFERRVERG